MRRAARACCRARVSVTCAHAGVAQGAGTRTRAGYAAALATQPPACECIASSHQSRTRCVITWQVVIRDVAAVLPHQFQCTAELSAALSAVDHSIDGVGLPAVAVWDQMGVVAKDLQGHWWHPSDSKKALADLGTLLRTMQPWVTSLDKLAGGRLQVGVTAMASAVSKVKSLDTVVCAGVDVGGQLERVASCWQLQDYGCVATNVKSIVDGVHDASSQFGACVATVVCLCVCLWVCVSVSIPVWVHPSARSSLGCASRGCLLVCGVGEDDTGGPLPRSWAPRVVDITCSLPSGVTDPRQTTTTPQL